MRTAHWTAFGCILGPARLRPGPTWPSPASRKRVSRRIFTWIRSSSRLSRACDSVRRRSGARLTRIGAAQTFRVRVLPEDRPRPTAGIRCPHRLHLRWRHPGQCARLPSDDAAGTAIHRPRDGAHHRAARWHRSSGPGWEWRGLEEQRHVVRDPPGDRGGPAGRAGGRARCGFATHHRPARPLPVRSSPSCSENAKRSRSPIEPDGSAQTAGSSRSSRRHAWSSAIGTTCATCTCSTVKRACSRSRALAVSGKPADGESRAVDISADGRFVVFAAEAGNLTDGAFAPGTSHVFLRDRIDGTTRLLTISASGDPANGPSRTPVIDGAGTSVAFAVGRDRSPGRRDAATESSSSASPPER